MSAISRLADTFRRQGALTQVIVVNVAIFLTVNLVGNLSHLELLPWLALPLSGHDFLFRFWTLFTYMFTHAGLGHLFWNMVLFYFFAQVFFTIMGERKLLYVYVMSGLAGGGLMLALALLMPQAFGYSLLLGASAAVLGVGGVMAVYSPNYRIYLFGMFEMAYKWFFVLTFALNTIIDLSVNTGGKISHMGGAAFGLLYGYYLRKGRDLSDISLFRRRRTVLRVEKPSRAATSDEKKMNELLDKISRSGYDSLTRAEKEELFRLSQKK